MERHDDGVYAVLAKSIAMGQGYRYLHLPGAPIATHYHPGYPMLLALLWKVAPDFPANVVVLLSANAILLGLTASGVYRFTRGIVGWPVTAAAAGAVVATLSYPLLMLSRFLLSEPFFAALLFPMLIVAERLVADEPGPAWELAVGVAVGAVGLVRTHAVALALALLLTLAVRRRWRTVMLCALGMAVMIAPWELWVALHTDAVRGPLRGAYGSYSAWLTEGARGGGASFVVGTVRINLQELMELLADRFSLRDTATVRSISSVIVAAVILIGWSRSTRRAPVTVLFGILYLAILLVWPYAPWRFVFGVWPLVIVFIGETIRGLRAARRGRVFRATAFMITALLVLGAWREETRAYRQRAWARAADAATLAIAPLVRWVNVNTRPGDVVATDGGQLVYLYTGRQAVPVAPFMGAEYVRPRTIGENAETLRQTVRDYPVADVLTIQPSVLASARLLADSASVPTSPLASHARLAWVTELPGGGVFRVVRR